MTSPPTPSTAGQFPSVTRDPATALVIAVVSAIGLAIAYSIGRIGFPSEIRPTIVSLGIVLFMVGAPLLFDQFGRPSAVVPPWWRSYPVRILGALVITLVVGEVYAITGVNLVWVLLPIGAVSCLWNVVAWYKRRTFVQRSGVALVAFLLTVWAAGTVWGTRYKMPLFWETLAFNGDVHHDPLYQVSIGNITHVYGVPSTGLDGIPYTPYHYGASWVNGLWADLAQVDLLTFYNLGVPVVWIPFFLFALLLLASELQRRQERTVAAWQYSLRGEVVAALVLLVATIGIIPRSGLDAVGIWNRHVLISESYLACLPVLLLAIGACLAFWDDFNSKPLRSHSVFLFLVLPLLVASLGLLKVSAMILLLCALLWGALRTSAWRHRSIAVALLIAVVVSLIIYKLVSVPAQLLGIVPFAFARLYTNPDWAPYFLIIHAFWGLAYIVLRIREERVLTVNELVGALRTRRLLDAELVAVIVLAAVLPGEVLNIHGGSAIYFSDLQRWIAVPLVIASAPRWIRPRNSDEVAIRQRRIGDVSLRSVLVTVVCIVCGLTMLVNLRRAAGDTVRLNRNLRASLYARVGIPSRANPLAMANPDVLRLGLSRGANYKIVTELRSVGRLPSSVRRTSLLFIPQSYRQFWDILQFPPRCEFDPLVGPATAGVALLDGMPAADCRMTTQYNMPAYSPRKIGAVQDVSEASICQRAMEKGFRHVIVLTGSDASANRFLRLRC